ncbi:MAG TPA: cupin domain-containing protein [Gammaproteobacteria bacterium]
MDKSYAPQVLEDLLTIDLHFDRLKWESFKEGVHIHRIYGDDKQGQSAALLRYAPGANVPTHVHTGYEHILVLSGSQTDGDNIYERGTLIISSPGSQHRIASDNGCIVLAIWQAPVDFTISI